MACSPIPLVSTINSSLTDNGLKNPPAALGTSQYVPLLHLDKRQKDVQPLQQPKDEENPNLGFRNKRFKRKIPYQVPLA